MVSYPTLSELQISDRSIISVCRSRGFGFVTFAQSTCVQDVQDQRPHTVDGKEIETKRATPKSVSSN